MTNGFVFLAAAAGLAATPGAGTLYVLARTLRGGWREGLASVGGTTSGGGVHVLAAALGGAALLGRDASRLRLVSLVGAAYLVFVAIRGLRAGAAEASPEVASSRRAFADGLVVALLNPNTALFLLAFLPQFVDPRQSPLPQLLALGGAVIALNAMAHLTWVAIAATLGRRTLEPPARLRLQRMGNVLLLIVAAYVLARAV